MKAKSFKRLENIVTNGDIARLEQFLLLPRCFQKSSAAEASENVYMWERVKTIHPLYPSIVSRMLIPGSLRKQTTNRHLRKSNYRM